MKPLFDPGQIEQIRALGAEGELIKTYLCKFLDGQFVSSEMIVEVVSVYLPLMSYH